MDSLNLQNDHEALRVANIILEGRFGGPQNRILQISERLKNFGIETTVIMPKKDSDPFYLKLVKSDIHVKRLNLHRLTKHLPHLIRWAVFFVPEVLLLSRYLRKERFKLIHCNSSWQMKGVLAGKLAGIKVVWHLNDTELPKALKLIFNLVGHLCDGFVVAGTNVYQFYLAGNRLKTKKVVEIQAPVNTLNLNPERMSKSRLIEEREGLKIMTMGTINPTKRIEDIIEVAHILSKKYENLSFYVVGQQLDNYKKYMKQLLRLVSDYGLKNVFFLGGCDDIASVLKLVDIYMCCSKTEASPMAVWEAMAMEKPIVSTDVGDVGVMIKDGESGFIVPPMDVIALTERIEILIKDKKMRHDFGKRARDTAIQKLDVEICVEKHRQFYLDILGVECLESRGIRNEDFDSYAIL